MRITSGKARGISLKSPKGDATRPATDAARQAIFSSLGGAVEGADVLDLFAGTGSYGLEALSRGAKSAVFIESSRQALAALRENLEAVKKSLGKTEASVSSVDAFRFANASGKNFGFVFADPPYHMLSDEKALPKILSLFCSLSGEGTVFILEAPAEFELPEEFGENESTRKKFEEIKRLGKKSKGKPSQIIFKIS